MLTLFALRPVESYDTEHRIVTMTDCGHRWEISRGASYVTATSYLPCPVCAFNLGVQSVPKVRRPADALSR